MGVMSVVLIPPLNLHLKWLFYDLYTDTKTKISTLFVTKECQRGEKEDIQNVFIAYLHKQ